MSGERRPRAARAEWAVAALLLMAAVAAVSFAVAQLAGEDTQVVGGALAVALAAIAAALGVMGRLVLPQGTEEEARPCPSAAAADGDETRAAFAAGASGVTRRRLLLAAGAVTGTSLAAASLAPLGSLGIDDAGIGDSPWRDGTALVDEDGVALRATSIEVGSMATAFPRGADPRELGSPVLVVRLPPGDVRQRRDWAPGGLLAFSKICTHAGCAVAMLRYPLYPDHSPAPALVCPCHYSTFDPAEAGRVLFGPAGRPLPQLPLRIADDGTLEAAGAMSGPVGPAWWGLGA